MDHVGQIIGVELIVEDLGRAVELFSGVLGMELMSTGPSPTVVGQLAVLDAGSITVTLLEPSTSGPGHVLGERTPRMSQLVIGVANSEVAGAVAERSMEAGLAVQVTGSPTFYLSPESVSGALGQRTAVVVTPVADDPS